MTSRLFVWLVLFTIHTLTLTRTRSTTTMTDLDITEPHDNDKVGDLPGTALGTTLPRVLP